MKKIQFSLIDISYAVDKNPQIKLFGRTTDNQQICVIEDFQPYFYVFTKNIEAFTSKVVKVAVEENDREAKVVGTEVVDKKYLGEDKKVVKVFTKHPSDVPIIKNVLKDWEIVEAIYEYDIPFTKRYLIDKQITPLTILEVEGEEVSSKARVPCFKASKITPLSEDEVKLNILSFDIETYSPPGEAFNPAKNPILMIAFYGENFKKVITWKRFKTDEDYIEFVDGEVELIERFKQIIHQQKPDIITGYFSGGFDFPYVISRAKKYDIDLDLNLDHSKIVVGKGKNKTVKLTGIAHVDVFRFIIKILGRSLNVDSYKLDDVAQELLGEKKDEVDITDLTSAWDEGTEELEKFCKYNLKDAELTYRLCEKVLPNMVELVKIVGQPLQEVIGMSFSQLVEWYIFKKVQDFNEIAPNRASFDQISERQKNTYTGGFVYEPHPGLYKNIVIFDFRSLYPTILSSHNICLSTLNKGNPGDDAEQVPDQPYYFYQKKKGFLPSIIEDLISRRMRVKELLKKKPDSLLEARSNNLKLLANSIYGYLGFYAARWYSLECARSITAFGRYHINKVIDLAKEKGFEVIYGDTDSVFMILQEKTKEDVMNFIDQINADLPGLMELEFEGLFPSGIFVSVKKGAYGAKKKYALLGEDGKIRIKGFETVRRNWSPIAKEIQKKVLSIILKEQDLPSALEYVKEEIKMLRDRKTPNEKVILKTQLQKKIDEYSSISPHVAIARIMKAKGIDVGPGTTIQFIITSGKGLLRDKARLPEDVEQGDYDPEYYINNQILPSVEKIFEVLGEKKENLTADAKQSSLGEYFS